MPSATERILLPANAPGTERSLLVHRFGRAGARPKVYIQAALHAVTRSRACWWRSTCCWAWSGP